MQKTWHPCFPEVVKEEVLQNFVIKNYSPTQDHVMEMCQMFPSYGRGQLIRNSNSKKGQKVGAGTGALTLSKASYQLCRVVCLLYRQFGKL